MSSFLSSGLSAQNTAEISEQYPEVADLFNAFDVTQAKALNRSATSGYCSLITAVFCADRPELIRLFSTIDEMINAFFTTGSCQRTIFFIIFHFPIAFVLTG